MKEEELIRALEELVNAIHAPAHMLLEAYQHAELVLRKAKSDIKSKKQDQCDHEYDLSEGGYCIFCGKDALDR